MPGNLFTEALMLPVWKRVVISFGKARAFFEDGINQRYPKYMLVLSLCAGVFWQYYRHITRPLTSALFRNFITIQDAYVFLRAD